MTCALLHVQLISSSYRKRNVSIHTLRFLGHTPNKLEGIERESNKEAIRTISKGED